MEEETLMSLVKSRDRTRNEQGYLEYTRKIPGVQRVVYHWTLLPPQRFWWIYFEEGLSLEAIERVCRENDCRLVSRSEVVPTQADKYVESLWQMLEQVGGAPLPRSGGYRVYKGDEMLISISWWPRPSTDTIMFSTGRRGLLMAEAYRRLVLGRTGPD